MMVTQFGDSRLLLVLQIDHSRLAGFKLLTEAIRHLLHQGLHIRGACAPRARQLFEDRASVCVENSLVFHQSGLDRFEFGSRGIVHVGHGRRASEFH